MVRLLFLLLLVPFVDHGLALAPLRPHLTVDALASGQNGCAVPDWVSMMQLSIGSLQHPTHRIPNQLVLTGMWESLEELPGQVGSNVHKTLALNPELHVRYLGDKACQDYLTQYFDKELAMMFSGELRGSFRGDICRAAVLWREGGFYTDLDVEWLAPMRSLVDSSTTFMSAYGEGTDMLNAMMAAEPQSKIMEATLQELRNWYHKPGGAQQDHKGWMGPKTLRTALQDVLRESCPELDLAAHTLEKACGAHKMRLYEQRQLHCNEARLSGLLSKECPPSRAMSKFEGLEFGLFEPGEEGKLVGWPRFADCASWGCGAEGWTERKAT